MFCMQSKHWRHCEEKPHVAMGSAHLNIRHMTSASGTLVSLLFALSVSTSSTMMDASS